MDVPLRNGTLIQERGTHHRLIFWWFEALVLRMSSQNFARDRIIVPKISVLNVLLRQLVIHWHLVTEYGEDGDKQLSLHKKEGERNKYAPVGAIVATIAFPLGIEGA
jgi:hypothetical protein